MDEIHVHKTKKSICAHFAESPCKSFFVKFNLRYSSVHNKNFENSTASIISYYKNFTKNLNNFINLLH